VTVSGVKDLAGNAASSVTSALTDVDTVNPRIIAGSVTDYLVTDVDIGENAISASWTFDKDMDRSVNPLVTVNVSVPGVAVSGGSWDATGRTYTATFDIQDENVEISSVVATISGAVDMSGNLAASFTGAPGVDIDTKNPTAVIESDVLSLSDVSNVVTYTVTFDEEIQAFSVSDLEISGGHLVKDSFDLAGNLATFQVEADDDSTENVSVTVKDTVMDKAGNTLLSITNDDVAVDTVNPTVENPIQILTNTGAVQSIGDGGVTKDNTVTLSGIAQDGSGFGSVEIYRETESGLQKVGDTSVGNDGVWTFTTSALPDGSHSYSAKAIDQNGNVTNYEAVSFNVDTHNTTPDEQGAVLADQLAVNGIKNGYQIRPFDGDISGDAVKLDLSAIEDNVIVDNNVGQVFANIGGEQLSALIGIANTSDVIAGFNVITTGAGDDLIMGRDDLSEVFAPGLGNNDVDGGQSASTTDYVDYRNLTSSTNQFTVGAVTAVAGSTTTTWSRTVTLAGSSVTAGVYSFSVGAINVAYAASAGTTAADLVAALAGRITELAANNAALASISATAAGSAITLSLTGDTETPPTALTALQNVLIGSHGIDLDLLTMTVDANDMMTGLPVSTVTHADGSSDELSNIEGVLGTSFNDVLVASDATGAGGDIVLFGDAGNDLIKGGAGNDILLGGADDDVIYGGAGVDRIIGGAGSDNLYGGSGKDIFVIGTDAGRDTIRDFAVANILSNLTSRTNSANDKIDFSFTNAQLLAAINAANGTSLTALPAGISTASYEIRLGTAVVSTAATVPTATDMQLWVKWTGGEAQVTSVNLNWGSNPFAALSAADLQDSLTGNAISYALKGVVLADPSSGNSLGYPDLFSNLFGSETNPHQLFATVQYERVGEIIDTSEAEAVVGGSSGDIFVMMGGNDVMIGGRGSDRYEARIHESSLIDEVTMIEATINKGGTVINELGRRTSVEQDVLYLEGIRDMGDLSFVRTQIASEAAGRTLRVGNGC
jgi:Ca2+-binding RTX toxin-like protein